MSEHVSLLLGLTDSVTVRLDTNETVNVVVVFTVAELVEEKNADCEVEFIPERDVVKVRVSSNERVGVHRGDTERVRVSGSTSVTERVVQDVSEPELPDASAV